MAFNNIARFFAPYSILLSSLTGLLSIAAPALADTTSTNPCPLVYYEEPYNSLYVLPAACPPNAATRSVSGQSQPSTQLPVLVPGAIPMTTLQPLLPSVEPAPIGTVQLQAGRVNVQLKNMTNTSITYQALGHTQQRTLMAKTDLVLQDLPAPVTLTFLRPDAGFIRVTMASDAGSGVLVLMLDEATGLSNSQTSARVQSNGNVLAY
jgi:hypothetical protein